MKQIIVTIVCLVLLLTCVQGQFVICDEPDGDNCVPEDCESSTHMARTVCPHLCGFCDEPTTTVETVALETTTEQSREPTTTVETVALETTTEQSRDSTTLPSTTEESRTSLTPEPQTSECEDHVLDPHLCETPGFCMDTFAPMVCKKTCGLCGNECRDSLMEPSCEEQNAEMDVCNDELGRKVCQKFCNLCP